MIDLHSHILPEIDDGAANLAVSLEMARLYVASGFRQVVATPHAIPENIGRDFALFLQDQVERLNQAMQVESIALTLKLGMEIPMVPEVPALLNEARLLPLAGSRYVLIEPPFERLPIHWDRLLFEIAARGYQILLAHPERCAQLSQNHHLFDRLIETGTHLQVNWGSFLGLHGRSSMKTARYLARRGYIHCLATDSHDNHSRSAAVAGKAAPLVAALAGPTNLNLLSIDNPACVISDEPLKRMVPLDNNSNAPGARRWWKFRRP